MTASQRPSPPKGTLASLRSTLAALAEMPVEMPGRRASAGSRGSSEPRGREWTALQASLVGLGYPAGQCAAAPWGLTSWQVLVPGPDGQPVVLEEVTDPDVVLLLRVAAKVDTLLDDIDAVIPLSGDPRGELARAARHLTRARVASAASSAAWAQDDSMTARALADHSWTERSIARPILAGVLERAEATGARRASARAEAARAAGVHSGAPVPGEPGPARRLSA